MSIAGTLSVSFGAGFVRSSRSSYSPIELYSPYDAPNPVMNIGTVPFGIARADLRFCPAESMVECAESASKSMTMCFDGMFFAPIGSVSSVERATDPSGRNSTS